MPGDMFNYMCTCPHMCKITSLSRNFSCQHHCQQHNRTYQIGTSLLQLQHLVTATFCFHNSTLSCFILNEIFNMPQQQETLYFRYTDLGLHMQFQIIKSNHLCRQGCTCKLMVLHPFVPSMD